MNETKSIGDRPQFILPADASFRIRLEEYWLRFIRGLTYHFPFPRGKYRLSLVGQGLCRNFPKRVRTPSRDGRMLEINFSPLDWDTIFFFGEYERPLSRVVSSLIRPGDICVDVGANLGWYTTLLSKLVGPDGQVHSFEPVPPTFAELKENVASLEDPSNVKLNNIALGDKQASVSIGFEEGKSTGFASIATGSGDAKKFECEMVKLSDYLTEYLGDREVTFLKADIEGAEMLMFLGSERLFQQRRLPILLVEMAADWGALLGHTPNDLLDFISARGDYRFIAFDGISERPRKVERFAPGDPGANVFCIPRTGHEERLEAVSWIFD